MCAGALFTLALLARLPVPGPRQYYPLEEADTRPRLED